MVQVFQDKREENPEKPNTLVLTYQVPQLLVTSEQRSINSHLKLHHSFLVTFGPLTPAGLLLGVVPCAISSAWTPPHCRQPYG